MRKNNKGLSLIELLVTITIIALIAVPLIRSFMTAIKLNEKAKLTQNATRTAEDISEIFKSKTLEELITEYENSNYRYDIDAEGNEVKTATGKYLKYNFKNIGDEEYKVGEDVYKYILGAEGERFFANIILDTKPKGGELYEINDYKVPKLSDLNITDSVIIYSQFSASDNLIDTIFEDSKATSKNTKKTGHIILNTEYISDSEYKYEVKLVSTYEYNGVKKDIGYDIAKGTLSEDENMPDIYLLMTQFNKTMIDLKDGIYYTRDGMDITYTFTDNSVDKLPEHEKFGNIYLIEQSANADIDNNTSVHMSKSNVKISQKGNALTEIEMADLSLSRINVFSNLYGINAESELTAGGKKEDYMYEMTVEIRNKKPDGDIITSFVTTKEK
jgi:prepilin-type N-terminal cleavage/methylation domain-containing protein